MEKFNVENILSIISDLAVKYGLRLLLAIITLFVGLWIIKIITKAIVRMMEKRDVDATIQQFLRSFLSMLLKILLIISVISMLGVEMTSFIAILTAVVLSFGMALSGTFQNFAGGVMLVLFRPFKVGDFIKAQGYTGTVKEIQIFNTVLTTPDNKTVIIPNGGLSTNAMTNYSNEPTRRVDFTFGIGYDDSIDKARTVIEGIINSDERILKVPESFIAVSELADSSVNFIIRVWVNSADYSGVLFSMPESIKKAFDKEGISIPFPQTDVHLYNEK